MHEVRTCRILPCFPAQGSHPSLITAPADGRMGTVGSGTNAILLMGSKSSVSFHRTGAAVVGGSVHTVGFRLEEKALNNRDWCLPCDPPQQSRQLQHISHLGNQFYHQHRMFFLMTAQKSLCTTLKQASVIMFCQN